MRQEIRLTGSGGQGVILSGIILTHALGIYEGKEVAQTQSYGPESRGGACRAELVVDDKKIDYIKVNKPDYYLAYNQIGFDKYSNSLLEDTYILVDSTFVKNIDGKYKSIHRINASKIAEDNLKILVSNLVLLGAFAKTSNLVSYNSLEKAVKDVIDEKYHDLNIKALELGYKDVDK